MAWEADTKQQPYTNYSLHPAMFHARYKNKDVLSSAPSMMNKMTLSFILIVICSVLLPLEAYLGTDLVIVHYILDISDALLLILAYSNSNNKEN